MNLSKDEIAKNKILTQAQLLFQQFGLRKTTMDEIATGCGKAKSTLYHYYKSKEEVFDAVVDMELRSLRKIVKKKVDQAIMVKEKIITYFLEFHQGALNKLNLYRIVKHEMLTPQLAHIQFSRLMEFEKSYIIRILEDGFDTGEFTQIEKEDIPFFSEMLLAAFFGIVRYSIETEMGFDQDKLKLAAKTVIPQIFA